ncbi:MAG: hypothetical protein KIH64_011690 [Mycobacterium sp.]|nr:hypothetical protein [Mycobacterium sp.]
MSLLEVNPGDLKRLAENCETWSTEVAVNESPSTPPGSVQATAAAVKVIHADTDCAGMVLSARMLATAASLAAAATAHTAQEARSTAELDEPAIGR